jgi:hypothetical protein
MEMPPVSDMTGCCSEPLPTCLPSKRAGSGLIIGRYLSLVLCFMKCRQARAFKGRSHAETLNAVINQPHQHVAELNQEVPPQLQRSSIAPGKG